MPGFESCTARILTDGSAVLMVGIQSHGQGLETAALSQIAAQEPYMGRHAKEVAQYCASLPHL
jgi:carbon-monoxide dehydrogenase large subunit